MERSDDTKASKNEDIRLRLGSLAQSHSQNQQQYRLNNASSHKNYKGNISFHNQLTVVVH